MTRRVGIIDFTPEFLVEVLRIRDKWPSAKAVGGTYDYDREVYRLKVLAAELPEHEEGTVIQKIDLTVTSDRAAEFALPAADITPVLR